MIDDTVLTEQDLATPSGPLPLLLNPQSLASVDRRGNDSGSRRRNRRLLMHGRQSRLVSSLLGNTTAPLVAKELTLAENLT